MLHGSMSSEDWPSARAAEFENVPRVCRLILGVYEDDISTPEYADRLVPEQVRILFFWLSAMMYPFTTNFPSSTYLLSFTPASAQVFL